MVRSTPNSVLQKINIAVAIHPILVNVTIEELNGDVFVTGYDGTTINGGDAPVNLGTSDGIRIVNIKTFGGDDSVSAFDLVVDRRP